MKDVAKKIAMEHLSRTKTAGEVRFIKDKSDTGQWAYSTHGPSERQINKDFDFKEKKLQDLVKCLRSTNASLGHVMSAYTRFAKMKSADLSPDGNLGGKGYIQKISDMRMQFMNIVEALSALSDTIYDEVRAPHWAKLSRLNDEIVEVLEDAEEIKEDPEAWAREEEEEMDSNSSKTMKKASTSEKNTRKILAGDSAKGKYRFVLLRNTEAGLSKVEIPNIYTASIKDLIQDPQVKGRPWLVKESSTKIGCRFSTSRYEDGSYHTLVGFRTDGKPFTKNDVRSMYRLLGA
jgi:hypothetical protein